LEPNLGHDQITTMNFFVQTRRRSCDVIILTLNLIIMSILGRRYGLKVITLTFLLIASDSVCIQFTQIVTHFAKLNQQVNITRHVSGSTDEALSDLSLGQ